MTIKMDDLKEKDIILTTYTPGYPLIAIGTFEKIKYRGHENEFCTIELKDYAEILFSIPGKREEIVKYRTLEQMSFHFMGTPRIYEDVKQKSVITEGLYPFSAKNIYALIKNASFK